MKRCANRRVGAAVGGAFLRGATRLGTAALCLWVLLEASRIYPFYFAYFNEFVGGPGNGYRLLGDGNLDWGQDLKRLATYLRRNNIQTVKLAYAGDADPRALGIHYEPLRPGEPSTGYIAIRATLLQGLFDDRRCTNAFEWLRSYQPVATIGYSILLYRIPPSQVLPPPKSMPACGIAP